MMGFAFRVAFSSRQRIFGLTAMATTPHSSTVQLTDEDREYAGTTFQEVVDALFANPYQRVWGGDGEPPLPVCEVTLEACSVA